MLELRSLRGKNASVIDAMRGRIEVEQQEFEASTTKIQAVRAVHMKMLRDLFQRLGPRGSGCTWRRWPRHCSTRPEAGRAQGVWRGL